MNIKKALLTVFITSTVWISSAVADGPNPYEFNVYAIQNIGTSSSSYGSDFQGIGGAGGNVYFSGFSLNDLGSYNPAQPYSLFTGGDVNFNGGAVNNGGISAGGNVNVSSISINGPVYSGGNLTGGNGTLNGNATLSGANTSALSINGSVATGQTYTPTVNLPSVATYFNNASSFWGGLTQTSSWINSFGQIQVSNLTSGRNVVNLAASDLAGVWGVKVSGPSDAFVIFNITGLAPNQSIQAFSLDLTGGVDSNDILMNVPGANSISLQGGQYTSFLAPGSNINYSSGVLAGNLIALNLTGSGQVNLGQFTGFAGDQGNFNTEVPEPSTYLLLGSLLLTVGVAQKRKKIATK